MKQDDAVTSIAVWLVLQAIPQLGRRRLWQLVAHFGDPEAVLRADRRSLCAVEGIDEVVAGNIVEFRDRLDMTHEASELKDLGARLISFLDSDYPRPLRASSDPPPVLFVLGELEPLDEIAVAVVGSRNMTAYGRQMAEHIAGGLADAGVTVVSGFATGIDGVAHRAALEHGGRTIAVLGCGLDVIYPAEHRRLRQRIIDHGALVSIYPLGSLPRAEHFPDRNRVLAALCQAVVIVEASEKSGALITANHAVEEGRHVFAVPGDATRTNSRGTNRLIQQGAHLVMGADEILAELQGVFRNLLAELRPGTAPADTSSTMDIPSPVAVLEQMGPEEREIFALIQAGPVHYDALVRRLPWDLARRQQVPMFLMNLQLHGLVQELPGKQYVARPSAVAATGTNDAVE